MRFASLAGCALILTSVFVAVLPAGPASAASGSFSFTTSPAMVPSFKRSIQDYAVRCTGSPTTTLSTSGSGRFTIGGQNFNHPASVTLPLVADQSVEVTTEFQHLPRPVPAK